MCMSNGTWLFVVAAKDPSGSSSDDGGFLREGAEVEGAGDSGHTLPVRNSRSVYSKSTKHHSHFGYRMERTHRRSLGHFRLRCSRFLICTRTAFYDFSWFYFVCLCFCHARALIILLRNLNLFRGDETATNQKLPCFFLYNIFQISDSLVSHTCVQLGVRNLILFGKDIRVNSDIIKYRWFIDPRSSPTEL